MVVSMTVLCLSHANRSNYPICHAGVNINPLIICDLRIECAQSVFELSNRHLQWDFVRVW
jgi:hypothetical protein